MLVIATFWGLLESTIAAVAAVLCFNYFFLPPIFTFTIASPTGEGLTTAIHFTRERRCTLKEAFRFV